MASIIIFNYVLTLLVACLFIINFFSSFFFFAELDHCFYYLCAVAVQPKPIYMNFIHLFYNLINECRNGH